MFDVAFGVVLLLLAIFLLWRPTGESPGSRPERSGEAGAAGPRRVFAGLGLSGLIGGMSGVMGIGGSPLQVVVLTHLMRVPVHAAMPTAQFMVLLLAVAGVATHVLQGHFDSSLVRLALLGPGVILGAQMGALLSERVSSRGLVRLLALAVLTVSLRLILAK